MKALVIEDNVAVRSTIRSVLDYNDYEVDASETAKRGKELCLSNSYEIIILDLLLPDGDGFKLCKELRKEGITTPVLILSVKQATDVKVKCLRAGADDYLTKPFNPDELVARIEAISRRTTESDTENPILKGGELEMNLIDRIVKVNEKSIELTNKEFELLALLLRNKNSVLTQKEISKQVWDIKFDTHTNYVNVYISYLRKKIRPHTNKAYISTVRNKGFVFQD